MGDMGAGVGDTEVGPSTDEQLSYLIDHAPVVVLAIDMKGTIVDYRGGGIRLTGTRPEDRIGRSAYEVYGANHPARPLLERALRGEPCTELVELRDRDAFFETHFAPARDDRGEIVGVVGIVANVTEREHALRSLRAAETRAAHAERFAAFSALAAGIAHEINNPLTYIALNLGRLVSMESARAGKAPLDPLVQHRLEVLQEMREGLSRVQRLAQDLRVFASDELEQAEPMDLGLALDAALRLTTHEVRHRAKLVRVRGHQPQVLANAGRLEQLLVNLLLHAARSIPEGESHLNTLEVKTSTDERGWAVIDVRDTGVGATPEHLEHLFATPGSNLAACRSLADELGGTVEARGVPGAGSEYRVCLPPAAEHEAEQPQPPAPQATARMRAPRGTPHPERRGRLLLIDDERALASALAAVLGERHDVVTAGSGREAFEVLRHDDAFDVILCDLIMPEVTGMDLYDAFHLVTPEIANRFVFMTGGAFTDTARTFVSTVPNRCISKPFDPDQLFALMEEMLAH